MNKVMGRSVILAGAVLFMGSPAMAAVTSGLIGDCVDCHTMHNSEQGRSVALVGTSSTPSDTPIANLLRMDCIACHADPTATTGVVDMGGGSKVPQVNHAGAASEDLAGGNFAYITNGSARNGHNVADLLTPDTNGEDATGLLTPPGMYRGDTGGTHAGAARFTMDGGFLANFTCAGSGGCHGTRNQAVSADTNANTTSGENGNLTGEDGPDFYENVLRLTGIPAISGAHHNSYDGVKAGTMATVAAAHNGQYVADGYRFIPGLKGAGNTTSDADRWQNASSTSHNEYYGNPAASSSTSCGACHQDGATQLSSHVYDTSFMKVPNQSISGFCMTCHGNFHSVGSSTSANGTSGAFLRHPSDYVIPNSGEYSAYTTYNISAPVARPDLTGLDGTDNSVNAGTDLVMCLSCHMAHASQYDAMLRFDYTAQQAGNAGSAGVDGQGLDDGCLACHTSKGILPQDR
jgi:hypothetical protein